MPEKTLPTKMLRVKRTGAIIPFNPDVARSDSVEVFSPTDPNFKERDKPATRRRTRKPAATKKTIKKTAAAVDDAPALTAEEQEAANAAAADAQPVVQEPADPPSVETELDGLEDIGNLDDLDALETGEV